MVSSVLKRYLNDLNINIPENLQEILLSYWDLLLLTNEKVNLISPHGSMESKIVNHLVDSLTPLIFEWPQNLQVMDFGSGGGLPGLPLKICRPDWNVTLVESKLKKANFLKDVCKNLNIKNCTIIDNYVDNKYQFNNGLFDLITARAIGKLNELIPKIYNFLKPGGLFLAYKGPKYTSEIEYILPILKKYKMELYKKHFFILPYVEAERNLVFIKKI
jgi:16S rRNA (guanine527-N7)-methyltransferase